MTEVKIISLKDKKSKELARVLSNKTSQEILHQLTKLKSIKAISEELDLPLTTVQSSIKNLEKVGLIEQTHYKWSPKGRKQRLYQPTKNVIIFAPERAHTNIIEVLKNNVVIPAVIAFIGGAGVLTQTRFKAMSSQLTGSKAFAGVAEDAMLNTSVAAESITPMAYSEPNTLLYIFLALFLIGLIWFILAKLRNSS